jgi:hypothetical protein
LLAVLRALAFHRRRISVLSRFGLVTAKTKIRRSSHRKFQESPAKAYYLINMTNTRISRHFRKKENLNKNIIKENQLKKTDK